MPEDAPVRGSVGFVGVCNSLVTLGDGLQGHLQGPKTLPVRGSVGFVGVCNSPGLWAFKILRGNGPARRKGGGEEGCGRGFACGSKRDGFGIGRECEDERFGWLVGGCHNALV